MNNFAYGDAGFKLTKQFEGLRLIAYTDQVGVWTIGWGHTGSGVHSGMTITEAQAETLLSGDVASAVTAVNQLVTSTINQNQFDALVDFAFNLGNVSLAHSTLLRFINAGDFVSAGPQFLLWDHAGSKVVQGLLDRRKAELALFNS
jgi:lysozyme